MTGRVLFGQFDGDMRLRISRPGFDVMASLDPDELIFDSALGAAHHLIGNQTVVQNLGFQRIEMPLPYMPTDIIGMYRSLGPDGEWRPTDYDNSAWSAYEDTWLSGFHIAEDSSGSAHLGISLGMFGQVEPFIDLIQLSGGVLAAFTSMRQSWSHNFDVKTIAFADPNAEGLPTPPGGKSGTASRTVTEDWQIVNGSTSVSLGSTDSTRLIVVGVAGEEVNNDVADVRLDGTSMKLAARRFRSSLWYLRRSGGGSASLVVERVDGSTDGNLAIVYAVYDCNNEHPDDSTSVASASLDVDGDSVAIGIGARSGSQDPFDWSGLDEDESQSAILGEVSAASRHFSSSASSHSVSDGATDTVIAACWS